MHKIVRPSYLQFVLVLNDSRLKSQSSNPGWSYIRGYPVENVLHIELPPSTESTVKLSNQSTFKTPFFT